MSAKQNVNKSAFLYCLLHILFCTGRATAVLAVSTMGGVQKYFLNYAVFQRNNDKWLDKRQSGIKTQLCVFLEISHGDKELMSYAT